MFPEGPRIVTLVISVDGEVDVHLTNRRGRMLDRVSGQIDTERAARVINDLLIASKLEPPRGYQVLLSLYDEPPDPAYGETRRASIWQSAQEVAQEVFAQAPRRGRHAGVLPYTPLSFVKWTLLFIAVIAVAVAIGELVGREIGFGVIEMLKFESTEAREPDSSGLLTMGILLLFGIGFVYERFVDTHRGDARPIWPALVAVAPFIFGAHTVGGWPATFAFGLYVCLPLVIVAFGLQVLNLDRWS